MMIVRLNIYLTIGLLLVPAVCNARQLNLPKIPRDQSVRQFELAARLADEDQGKLWGVSLKGPMIFVDRGSREVVANKKDGEGKLREDRGVWRGTLPENVQPANTSLEWAGVRWTMVMWDAIPNSDYESGRLLMHESFHRVQPQLGFPAASPLNSHLDSHEGRSWLRLEMRALAEAMIRSGEQRRSAAKDALLFRAARHALVGKTSADEEAALEANEGICEYTGLRLSGLPLTAAEQRIAIDLERRESSENFTRSFAYATGPALCFLLDEYDPDWRATAVQNSNLARRLSTALKIDPSTSAVAFGKIAAEKYSGEFVFREEEFRAEKRAARLAELKATYIDGRVLRITTGKEFRFSFNPNTAESIDGSRVVHQPLTASDEWGTLDAPHGAMLDFNAPMAIVLPIPVGATVEAVAWNLKLKPGFSLTSPADGTWQIIRGPPVDHE